MLMRAELSALVGLLQEKGVFTLEEWQQAMIEEAELLSKDYEQKFPGCRATDIGIDIDVARAYAWMRKWKP